MTSLLGHRNIPRKGSMYTNGCQPLLPFIRRPQPSSRRSFPRTLFGTRKFAWPSPITYSFLHQDSRYRLQSLTAIPSLTHISKLYSYITLHSSQLLPCLSIFVYHLLTHHTIPQSIRQHLNHASQTKANRRRLFRANLLLQHPRKALRHLFPVAKMHLH